MGLFWTARVVTFGKCHSRIPKITLLIALFFRHSYPILHHRTRPERVCRLQKLWLIRGLHCQFPCMGEFVTRNLHPHPCCPHSHVRFQTFVPLAGRQCLRTSRLVLDFYLDAHTSKILVELIVLGKIILCIVFEQCD